MQQRKDEIQAKKAKLAELKRQRELRQQGITQRTGPLEIVAPTPSRSSNDRDDLDGFIKKILGEPNSASHSPRPQITRPSSGLSSFAPGAASSPAPESTKGPSEILPQAHPRSTIALQTLSTAPVVVEYEFKPVQTINYNAGTQTLEIWTKSGERNFADGLSDSDPEISQSLNRSPSKPKRPNRREREREEQIREKLRKEIKEELQHARNATGSDAQALAALDLHARALDGEEVNILKASDEFIGFIERSSTVVERLLDQEYDLLTDYAAAGSTGFDDDDDEGFTKLRGKQGRRIKEIAQFYDARWSKKRMISDISFSPKFPELLVASYTKNPSAPQDPSGLLQVWNLHLQSRPEYVFHSTSDVLTSRFSPFHPSLLLAGTYSGQLLLFDTRSRSPLPVQKTPLTGTSSRGHTHPVYSIDLVGTQNANNVISCSTDGIVCGWSIDMLSQPLEFLELTTPPPSKIEEMSPTCMAFPPSDPTSFIVGTEAGHIYPCHRYDHAGAKAGVDQRIRYKGHTAPVMSVDFHPARGALDLSDLVITSSLDWSVKIWKTRSTSSAAAAAAAAQSRPTLTALSTYTIGSTYSASTVAVNASTDGPQDVGPSIDIPREDVVYSARWSPTRPAVFALVDGAGYLEVFDLNTDVEVPVARAQPAVNKHVGGYVAKSLNKVTWEEKEGRRIGVGGASSVVSVFEVGGGLSGEGESRDEWVGVRKLVAQGEKAATERGLRRQT
ncbi:hypothetical protein MMC25_007779 [Agyrium rufum]|nr:hypothetical protein [Agyrium rufum]